MDPLILTLALLLSVVAVACSPAQPTLEVPPTTGPPAAEPEPTPAAVPVTRHGYSLFDPTTLDPQLVDQAEAAHFVENLFVHLTNYDPGTSDVVPEAATSWEVSDDGQTYTFKLRTDIPWVHHDPETGETTQVVDAEGNPRFVTAQDFAYGIRHACDPNLGSYYSSIIAPLIEGCEDVLFTEDPENISQDMLDAIGVAAPADDTLVVELAFPAAYFLSMTPMWTLAAAPEWAIEEHGDQWIEPGNIVTNGRYVLHDWERDTHRELWRNPLMPADMRGPGNVERIEWDTVPDLSTGYALWLDNQVDSTRSIPDAELRAHLEQFPEQTEQEASLCVAYVEFATDKPPFDDARVRRAFSAAIDRQTFTENVLQGQGLPMKHFAPPGIFGAPAIDEVGVGFDPAYAQQQLADAGYESCQKLPAISLAVFAADFLVNQMEYIQGQWGENLGCGTDQVQIEQLPGNEIIDAIHAETERRPNAWFTVWCPDYPDENNWVGDVLWCKNEENPTRRTCTALDDLIVEARTDPDQDRRVELYRQIEEGFFGPEGEMPFAPLFTAVAYKARHLWYDWGPHNLFGGNVWYDDVIDWEAQQAARGK